MRHLPQRCIDMIYLKADCVREDEYVHNFKNVRERCADDGTLQTKIKQPNATEYARLR